MASQSDSEFREMVAAYPSEPAEWVSSILYGRGSLSKEVRREVCTMLKDFQIIVSVARDPEGVLVFRPKEAAA